MKTLARFAVPLAVIAAIVTAPLAEAQAQVKPAVVISLADLDEQLADVTYLAETAGFPEVAFFLPIVKEQLAGLDLKKPIGGYITLDDEGEPSAVGFVGVTDLDAVLTVLEEQLGEAENAGNGVKKLVGPDGNAVYIKESKRGGWAFVSDKKENLKTLPMKPDDTLGGLNKKYNLAVQINVQNVPQKLKADAIGQMKLGYLEMLDQAEQNDPQGAKLLEGLGGNLVDQITQLTEETDQITLGWSVNAMTKSTYIDLSMTALQGTNLAKQFAGAKDVKSNFAGFADEDAAAHFNLVTNIPETDVAQAKAAVAAAREQMIKGIDDDGNLPERQKKVIKELAGAALDIFENTLESGKFDAGGKLMLDDTLTFVAGGHVADGKAVEALLKKVAKLAEAQAPDFPGIKFNAAKYKGVSFHTLSIPVPDARGREILGDNMEIAVGTGDESVYFAFGEDGVSEVKASIDASATAKEVPSGQITVSLHPIMKFAAAVTGDATAGALADAIAEAKGNDKISIVSKYIPNGSTTRITVDQGVIKMFGDAAREGLGGGAGRPGI